MTLPVSVSPYPDEHLPGVIVRAANAMGYDFSSEILIPLGFKSRAESVASAPHLKLVLADHLGCTLEDLAPHFVERGERSGWIKFYGAEIRSMHREVAVRRLAPGTLAACGYHKAAWQVRAFCFDPATMERLISDCPVCGNTLRFTRVRDLAFCDSCDRLDQYGFVRSVVDLRDWPQEKVEVNDMAALRFVTGLVDPDPDVREAFRPSLHPDLDVDRGALFEFVISLAGAITQDPKRAVTSIAKPGSREAYDRVEPETLAKAGRILMSWPEKFHELCGEVRSAAGERDGHYGLKKELGPLAALTIDRALKQELQEAVRKAIGHDMEKTSEALPTVRKGGYRNRSDLLTAFAAAKEFGIRPKLFKRLGEHPDIRIIRNVGSKNSPMLFERTQVQEIAELRADMIASSSAAIRLGLPNGAMSELAVAGLIKPITGPVLMLAVGNQYYSASSVDTLASALESKAIRMAPPSTYIRLTKAAYRLPPGPKPWVEIINKVLDGSIPVYRIDGRLTGTMTSLAAPSFASVVAAVDNGTGAGEATDGLLTHNEVSILLGVNAPMVGSLVARKFIPVVSGAQVSIRREDVLLAAKTWIFTNELSRRLKVPPRLVRTTLADLGVTPAHALRPKQWLIFDRKLVEAAIAHLENARLPA